VLSLKKSRGFNKKELPAKEILLGLSLVNLLAGSRLV
jgi:hypothetical protein